MIVAWSSDANESDWVKDEAVFARDKGKLIPICLTDCDAPIGFRQYQTIDFQKWKGDASGEAYQALVSAIAEVSGGEAPTAVVAAEPSMLDRAREKPAILVAAAAAILLLGVVFVFMGRGGGSPDQTARLDESADAHSAGELSIAVLPFADMSPEGNQEYFADGLSEDC